ncbi:DMT family transporter [Clostridium sp. Marseille-P299]|uniref:DMT family transporter n=1 Tax=Clostridium sp. Marseille-P299 TaxID=1805477 RepID=UPI00082F12D3|nr:multidrug resistance efflux transporter family protein [Clostridium sp. Marseille-P299]
MKKSLFYGILASFFFAFTFILNRSMNLDGGYWMWSASLRYIFMLPILFVILISTKGIKMTLVHIKENLVSWIVYSSIGFGIFYTFITLGSVYGNSYFVAATWQITIVAGILLTPLFHSKIPVKNLLYSILIVIGVFILQLENMEGLSLGNTLLPLAIILVAAFAYPLGNRKMMSLCKDSLSTLERVFGMTLCSMPYWIILSIIAYSKEGLPSKSQVEMSVLVALFSGVIATLLFFKATDMIKNNPKQLAIIEATQSGEVVFSLLGGIIISGDPIPSIVGFIGLAFIIIGMVINSMANK